VSAKPSHSDTQTGPDPGGEAAAAREERRERRLAALDAILDLNLAAAVRLSQYIGGGLAEHDAQPFARLNDPCLALDRLTRSIGRIVALQERIDESAETREARLKAERAARDKAERDEQARREADTAEAELAEKKNTIRRAVREAHRDAFPDFERADREDLLDDLVREFEDHDDYERDPAEIVAELCTELGLMPVPPAGSDDEWDRPDDYDEAALAAWKAALSIKVAQGYLRDVSPRKQSNGHDPPEV